MTRLLAMGSRIALGSAEAALRFIAEERPEGRPGARFLQLDEKDAFELTFWCGTCPLLFRRLDGATRTMSIEGIQDRLNVGLDEVDMAVVQIMSAELLPAGQYLPVLLELRPVLVTPMHEGDYFADEQVEHRGPDSFWGLPHFPQTQYYRGDTLPISETATVFEFVVPWFRRPGTMPYGCGTMSSSCCWPVAHQRRWPYRSSMSRSRPTATKRIGV